MQEKGIFRLKFIKLNPVLKWSIYVGVIVVALIFGNIYGKSSEFIYFQF